MKSISTVSIFLDQSTLPTYLDGSDGSLWASRDAWQIMLSEPIADVSTRRFVKVSDLLILLRSHGIQLTNDEILNSSSGGEIITSGENNTIIGSK